MWAEGLDLLFERLRDRSDLSELEAVAGSGQQHGTVYLNDGAAAALANLEPRSPLLRTNHTAEGFQRRVQEAGLKTEVVILQDGESWTLPTKNDWAEKEM